MEPCTELRASSLEWRQLAGAAEDAAAGVLRRLDGLRGHADGHRRFVSCVFICCMCWQALMLIFHVCTICCSVVVVGGGDGGGDSADQPVVFCLAKPFAARKPVKGLGC